jgi:membrane protein YdbS with pleckstrin-like domain
VSLVGAVLPLDPRVVGLWRLQRVVRLAVFWVPVGTVAGLGASSWAGAPVGVLVAGVLIGLQMLLAVIWPGLEYRYFRYAVRDRDLWVQQGVLFRSWSCIPFDRIQHVDTRQGPLERILGLSRLQVYTAAGVSADGSVPGLAHEDASRLRDALAQRGSDDGV